MKNLKKKLRRQQKLEATLEGNSNAHTGLEGEQAGDNQYGNDTSQLTGDQGTLKTTKKRKKKDADEKINEVPVVETLEQPKKKKKKGFTETADNLSSSEHKEINERKKLQPNTNLNVEETKHNLSETDNKKKRKKKKKANRESTSEMKHKTNHNTSAIENSVFKGISDSRLAAYGENPKKIKNKIKYGKQNF